MAARLFHARECRRWDNVDIQDLGGKNFGHKENTKI